MYTYDEAIKVGDLITSYSSGYFRVTEIEKRYYSKGDESDFDFLEKEFGCRPKIGEEHAPLVHSRKLLTSKFKKRAGNESCSASLCSKVDPDVQKQIESILANDPTIENNSIKKYRESKEKQSKPLEVSNSEVNKMIERLKQCKSGQNIESVLSFICPTLFTGIEVANGFVNSGKQFAVHLNKDYAITVIYNEKANLTTEYVSGEIYKKNCLT